MNNQRDFSRISDVISGTYDAREATDIQAFKQELEQINRKYREHKKRLRHNPFGVFGGSPESRPYKYGIPFKKLSEERPLIEQLRDKKSLLPPIKVTIEESRARRSSLAKASEEEGDAP